MQQMMSRQLKRGNHSIKLVSVFANHLVAAMHCASGRWKRTSTGVGETLSLSEQRLLTHYTFAADFLSFPESIRNDPMSGNELDRLFSLVRFSHDRQKKKYPASGRDCSEI